MKRTIIASWFILNITAIAGQIFQSPNFTNEKLRSPHFGRKLTSALNTITGTSQRSRNLFDFAAAHKGIHCF